MHAVTRLRVFEICCLEILYTHKHERLKRRRAEVDAKPKLLCIDIGATCLRGSCASGKLQRIHYIFIFLIEVTISQSLSLNFLYFPYRVLSLIFIFIKGNLEICVKPITECCIVYMSARGLYSLTAFELNNNKHLYIIITVLLISILHVVNF